MTTLTIEERVTRLEKETAALKQQLEERQIFEDNLQKGLEQARKALYVAPISDE